MPASPPNILPLAAPATADRRATRFDWTMLALSALLVGGFYLDGWAHLHQRISGSMFTPWHALLYASAVGVTICILAQALPRYAAGTPLREAAPAGYGLYFAILALSEGLGWSIHLWMGSWLLAGVSGLLISILVVPPPGDEA